MMSRHPARWQNVLSGADAANASHSDTLPSSGATEIIGGQRVGDGSEPELGEQTLEPRQRAPQPRVVAYPGEQRHVEAGLPRIDLPRVDVERARHAAPLAVAERRAPDRVG